MFRIMSICLLAACAAIWSTAALAQASFEAVVADADGNETVIEGLQDIAIDDITWDYKTLQSPQEEPRTNLNAAAQQGSRLYGPGQAHWGNAKFTSAVTLGGSKELQAWWQEAAEGKNIRKNISVTLFKSDKQPGRSYTLHDCFPTQWSSVNFNTSSTVQTETLTVNIGWIEFKEAARTGNFVKNGGVVIVLDGLEERWAQWGDGEPQMLLTGVVDGKFHTNSPGHKTVGEITLRGAMTDGRQALYQWINETVMGKPWKRKLTITELLSVGGGVKPGKSYTYLDGFPVRYVFPSMSVTNTTGNTMEEVTLKFIRVELK